MSVDKYFNLNNKSKQKEKEEEKINQSFGQPFFFPWLPSSLYFNFLQMILKSFDWHVKGTKKYTCHTCTARKQTKQSLGNSAQSKKQNRTSV